MLELIFTGIKGVNIQQPDVRTTQKSVADSDICSVVADAVAVETAQVASGTGGCHTDSAIVVEVVDQSAMSALGHAGVIDAQTSASTVAVGTCKVVGHRLAVDVVADNQSAETVKEVFAYAVYGTIVCTGRAADGYDALHASVDVLHSLSYGYELSHSSHGIKEL